MWQVLKQQTNNTISYSITLLLNIKIEQLLFANIIYGKLHCNLS